MIRDLLNHLHAVVALSVADQEEFAEEAILLHQGGHLVLARLRALIVRPLEPEAAIFGLQFASHCPALSVEDADIAKITPVLALPAKYHKLLRVQRCDQLVNTWLEDSRVDLYERPLWSRACFILSDELLGVDTLDGVEQAVFLPTAEDVEHVAEGAG